MTRARPPRDPWQHAPTSELGDQVLPRWFVLLALIMVIAAVIVIVVTFRQVSGGGYEPVAARRPPPGRGLTSEARLTPEQRDVAVRDAGVACAEGVLLRGRPVEIETLRSALAELCEAPLPPLVRSGLRRLGERNARYAFAELQPERVDVTRVRSSASPLTVLNASLADQPPAELAPLLAYDAALVGRDPATARAVLDAREAEAVVCDALLSEGEATLACADARALTTLDASLEELRAAGFR